MDYFTLLIFDWNDEIITTATLGARDVPHAVQMAEHIVKTRPQAAGFQLWQDANRIYSTFPMQWDAGHSTIRPPGRGGS
jgi:hypothetical protein